MKNPARSAPRGTISSDYCNNNTRNISEASTPAQADPILSDDISLGRIWKSPRDKTRAVEAVLKSFNGYTFVDIRAMQVDGHGRMRPTSQRLTISVKQLGKFSQMIGSAYRRAEAMGLTPRSS